jgi:SAM-dependent methyltransferase
MEQVDCNLCGSSSFAVFAEMVGHKTKKHFRIVRCGECGLMFVSPRLTREENDALYDEAYFNGEGFDPSVNYIRIDQQDQARAGENRGILRKIRALKPGQDMHILDVGCGTGSLLQALGAAGYAHVTGVELSGYAADIARKSTSAVVLTGDILDLPLAEGSFDVINATEVIEHLRDPRSFFERVRALLRPGGVFIYSTGNARGIYARVLGRRWPYLHPEGHLFYYSPETLAGYFERVGLRPLDAGALGEPTRREIMAADDAIAHSQLHYIGQGERGIKGAIARAIAWLETPPVMRAWSLLLGKSLLPIGVNPSELEEGHSEPKTGTFRSVSALAPGRTPRARAETGPSDRSLRSGT